MRIFPHITFEWHIWNSLSGHIPYTYCRTNPSLSLALSSFNHFDEITIFNVYFYYYYAAATSEKIKLVKEIFFHCWIMLSVCVREEICRHVGTHLTHIYRHFCLLLHRRALCSIFLFYATTTLQQPSAHSLTHSLSPIYV